jgi:hypothetical protein
MVRDVVEVGHVGLDFRHELAHAGRDRPRPNRRQRGANRHVGRGEVVIRRVIPAVLALDVFRVGRPEEKDVVAPPFEGPGDVEHVAFRAAPAI